MNSSANSKRGVEQTGPGAVSAPSIGAIDQRGDFPQSTDKTPGILEAAKRVVCRLRPEDRLLAERGDGGPAGEKFRVLRHRLHQVRQQRNLRSLLITSSIPQEGKTVVAINLAITLALNSSRVLLVDADMRKPGVSRALGLQSLKGLAEVLEGRLDLFAAIRLVDPLNLYFLPAGSATRNPVELLQGAQIREAMARTRSEFDWIVIDSPPLNPFADSQCLAGLSDGVLLVVRAGLSPRESVEQALAGLDGAYIAGVVLNASGDPRIDSYYSYYYRYAPSAAASSPLRKPGKAAGHD